MEARTGSEQSAREAGGSDGARIERTRSKRTPLSRSRESMPEEKCPTNRSHEKRWTGGISSLSPLRAAYGLEDRHFFARAGQGPCELRVHETKRHALMQVTKGASRREGGLTELPRGRSASGRPLVTLRGSTPIWLLPQVWRADPRCESICAKRATRPPLVPRFYLLRSQQQNKGVVSVSTPLRNTTGSRDARGTGDHRENRRCFGQHAAALEPIQVRSKEHGLTSAINMHA